MVGMSTAMAGASYGVMSNTMISASIMMSVRNITGKHGIFFRVRRDREMSFAGCSILNEIIPILPNQKRLFQDP